MTNLVATTPITTKTKINLYGELNRQKDLKRTYCKKYKDLQAVVTTSEHKVLLQQLTVVTSTKAKANPQVLKVASRGKNKEPIGKGKGAKPLSKGKVMLQNHPLQQLICLLVPLQTLGLRLKTDWW